MITKELQQLSDKLTGGHTSAHEISKQVDYIEKNYEGGGSGGGFLILTIVSENGGRTLSETWQTIFDAHSNGASVWLQAGDETSFTRFMLCGIQSDPSNGYGVEFYNYGSYSCMSPDEKPAIMD